MWKDARERERERGAKDGGSTEREVRKTAGEMEEFGEGEEQSHAVGRNEGVGEGRRRGGIRRRDSEPPDGDRHEQ